MQKKPVVGKPIIGNRPPSANNRLVINAPQKVGMGGPLGVSGGVVERIGGLTVTQAAMQTAGVSGVAMSNLNDPNKNLLNFNIQGTNAKVISNRPGVAVSGATPGSTIPDVGVYGSNSNLGQNGQKINVDKLAANEEDERYRYLLKNGIVRRVEDEDKIIFAELPQIPGVLVVYRKPSERNANPDRLNLDKRELTHMPLLEGEERLRLLNLQHNHVSKIENLVSLPALIFLDLYNNSIKEISHLHTVPTLRVLMLGKNYIERIRNLQNLTKLDVLDLHSNKITKIENISHLSELRVLNLANNLITHVEGLNGLVSLTEINLRRNLIESVQGLNNCPRLQRIFLSNNRIEKFDSMASIKDAHQLSELALDGNPVTNKEGYFQFCIKNCPSLKNLDMMKITQEMRDNNGVPSEMDKAKQAAALAEGLKNGEQSATTDLSSSEKHLAQNQQQTANNAASNDDISPEGLLNVISQEWKNEMDRIISLGLNGYKRRKESRNDCLVQSGHAEIEGDQLLFIYGNALEVLNNQEFQKTVVQISFQYVRFDSIISPSNISKLKRFVNLKKLLFQDNNIYSFIQISKLEALQSLTSLSIESNEVSDTVLLRTFIVYRFPNVTEINGDPVTDSDKQKARQQFQHFDKILSTPTIFSPKIQEKTHGDESKEDRQQQVKNNRLQAKKNAEAAQNFVTNLTQFAVSQDAKIDELNSIWGETFQEIIIQSVKELTQPLQHDYPHK